MKLIRFKRVNWIVAMAMFALPGALLTSCSKETNPTEEVVPKGDKLTISVLGINNGDSNVSLKGKASSSNTAKAGIANSTTAAPTVYEFADVDMAVSVGNSLPSKQSHVAVRRGGNGLMAAAGLKAAAEPVESGIKYVVYLYDDNDEFVTSVELEAGTVGTIADLDPTASYTWVALSYSSKDEAPPLTPNGGSIDDLPANTDVLYAGDVVDLATDPTIEITFDHAFARIGIELNTIGVFGDIDTSQPTSITVSGLSAAAGSINLLDGSVTPGADAPLELTFDDFENVDPAYDDAKIAYVYTASAAEQNVTVTLQNLTITHVDGGLSRTYFDSPANFTSNITPEAGKNHHLLLNVVESPLTVGTGASAVKWSRSNLYYRGDNGGLRDYAFYATNELRSRADGYFSYGGTVPLQFPTEATSGDPCALVYPAGLWVQPTDAQVTTLTSGQGLLTGVLNAVGDLLGGLLGTVVADPAPGSTVGDGYAQYAITGGGTSTNNAFGDGSSNSNNLRIFYNGQITDTDLLSGIGTDGSGLLGLGLSGLSVDLAGNSLLDLGLDEGSGIPLPVLQVPILGTSYEVQAAFWSRTGNIEIPLLGTSVGSWGYAAYTETPRVLGIRSGSDFVKATTTAELLSNIDLLGIDLLNTSFKNVRCVRAN